MRPSLAHDLKKTNAQAALGYSLLVFALPHLLQQNQHRHLHVNLITMTTSVTMATRKAMTSSR